MVNFNSIFKVFIVIIVSSVSITLAQDEGSTVLQSVALEDSIWRQNTIQVCWESSADSFTIEKNWTRDAVMSTWVVHSDLNFIGWLRCQQTDKGIRIGILDDSEDSPHVKKLGRYLNGYQDGMILNFTFRNWGTSCQTDREYCIRALAVHEFGHAIGFTHEQNRPDSPKWCQEKRQGTDGDWFITPFDLNSVMNYCNPRSNNGGQLSQSDIEGVSILYPVKGTVTKEDRTDANVQFNLGNKYYSGRGVDQNYETAAYWYRLAADQGHTNAQRGLGVLYYNGQGVDQNYETTAYWWKLAADQGNADAQRGLGVLYYTERGVGKNYETAAYWYRLAADQGNADAQRMLGVLYYNGRGVEQNHDTAAYWWKLAADQGNADAKTNLENLLNKHR